MTEDQWNAMDTRDNQLAGQRIGLFVMILVALVVLAAIAWWARGKIQQRRRRAESAKSRITVFRTNDNLRVPCLRISYTSTVEWVKDRATLEVIPNVAAFLLPGTLVTIVVDEMARETFKVAERVPLDTGREVRAVEVRCDRPEIEYRYPTTPKDLTISLDVRKPGSTPAPRRRFPPWEAPAGVRYRRGGPLALVAFPQGTYGAAVFNDPPADWFAALDLSSQVAIENTYAKRYPESFRQLTAEEKEYGDQLYRRYEEIRRHEAEQYEGTTLGRYEEIDDPTLSE